MKHDYAIDTVLGNLGLADDEALAKILDVPKKTLEHWRNHGGIVPGLHQLKVEQYQSTLPPKITIKEDTMEEQKAPISPKVTVSYMSAKLSIGKKELARRLGVSYPTLWKWETKNAGIIPYRYAGDVKLVLQGQKVLRTVEKSAPKGKGPSVKTKTKVPKKTKGAPKKEKEIIDANMQGKVMILAGRPKDLAAIIANINWD